MDALANNKRNILTMNKQHKIDFSQDFLKLSSIMYLSKEKSMKLKRITIINRFEERI